MYSSAALVFGVLSSSQDAMAQETRGSGTTPRRASVENADLLSVGDSAGTPVQRLIGNVRLRQGETRLHANRAIRYEARGEILFVGNVVVFERGDTLFADRVLYRESTKVSRASGRVRLSDGEVVVTAPSAVYHTSDKYTEFTEGVHLVDSTTVLASERGTYWSEEKRAAFSGRVRLKSEDVTVHADSLSYERETEVSIATGDVFVYALRLDDSEFADTTSVTAVVAGWAYTDPREGLRRMRDDVLLYQVRFDSSKTDTLLLKSDLLHVVEGDTTESMFATGDVSIWNMGTAARADSITYTSRSTDGVRRERIQFFRSPMSWYKESQVSGDSLWIASTGGEPDTLVVRGRTFLADMDSVLQRVHQVRGANLDARFLGGGRRRMTVSPNAEAIYYLKKDGKADGAVRTSADRIIFVFENDRMKHVRAEGGVEGGFHPEHLLPQDFKLDGFRWVPERRPQKTVMLASDRMTRHLNGLDRARDGYTVAIVSHPNREDAEVAAARLRGRFLDDDVQVDVYDAGGLGSRIYVVGVGWYPTRAAASRALREMTGLPAGSAIRRVTGTM